MAAPEELRAAGGYDILLKTQESKTAAQAAAFVVAMHMHDLLDGNLRIACCGAGMQNRADGMVL